MFSAAERAWADINLPGYIIMTVFLAYARCGENKTIIIFLYRPIIILAITQCDNG